MDFRAWLLSAITALGINFFGWIKPPPVKQVTLAGEWLLKTGNSTEWSNPKFDDSGWGKVQVPSAWENQGYQGYDGWGWYRYHVTIPQDWEGVSKGLIFEIGKIDDEDTVYFNGRQIGKSTGWTTWRSYSIPSSLVRYGQENVIAIQVLDTGGGGGIWEGPMRLYTGIPRKFDTSQY